MERKAVAAIIVFLRDSKVELIETKGTQNNILFVSSKTLSIE